MRGEFEVRVSHGQPVTPKTLTGVNFVLIANPSDKAVAGNPPPHHVSASDIQTLTKFVEGGGGADRDGKPGEPQPRGRGDEQAARSFRTANDEPLYRREKARAAEEDSIIGGLTGATTPAISSSSRRIIRPGRARW